MNALKRWMTGKTYRRQLDTLLVELLEERHRATGAEAAAGRAYSELLRIQGLLAPVGEKIMRGMTADDDIASLNHSEPIKLPPLEMEMAKAFLQLHARMPASVKDHCIMTGFNAYSWRGRRIIPADID